ncbi:MAG: M13 family metallopeptidase [Steroidobacteraceae bacterium]
MNSRWLSIGLSCMVAMAFSKQALPTTWAATTNEGISQSIATSSSVSGLEMRYVDPSVRPQDDLYRYINGRWLDSVAIPSDKARYGAFNELADATETQLRSIVDELLQAQVPLDNSEAQKIRDLYASFMDEARLEILGLQPLQAELQAIDKLDSPAALAAHMAHLVQIGVNVPLVPYVHQDNRDSTRYAVDLYQAGLGLPDRDYYLQDGEEGAYKKIRAAYREHITVMLQLARQPHAVADAQKIVRLETALAKAQWDKVINRDPIKTYNKYPLDQLRKLAPDFDWLLFMQAGGFDGRVEYLLVSQPSYVTAFGRLLRKESLQTWRQYLKWRVISEFAPYLSKNFVNANFAFAGNILRGIPENRPRWKRGLTVLEAAIGEGLGKLYVARYFPLENKQRMETLVNNLLIAYRQSIDQLQWMSEPTRQAAQEKLARLTVKIGYPRQWRDYSTLRIAPDDLLGNVMRAQQFEYRRQINKLGEPVDRNEWQMTPQTVNAYYNPELNEIVFPAAILQPPFFNAQADDAVNYGGIGAVIGHEISHGFDDQGSQYDGDGNLRDWWTPADHVQFAAKTQALVAQYSAYEPVPGYKINGALTLGENIADNSGLAIAHKAYVLSLQGRSSPVMEGLSGEQRFFGGWAQVWRNKTRKQEEVRLLATDSHSPDRFRAWGAAVNQPAFYDAFAVKPGDKMYLPPEQRVTIW